jgi:hypothetical protein
LAKVIGSIVSLSQSAFIKGRQLVDGVLVLNEVVDFAKKLAKSVSFSRWTSKRRMIPLIGISWCICFTGSVLATFGLSG